MLVPPLLPLQPQVQGPEPETSVAVPVEQRPEVGTEDKLAPLLDPQVPLTGTPPVEQAALAPPLIPAQFQAQGPEPVTAVGLPIEQRFVLG